MLMVVGTFAFAVMYNDLKELLTTSDIDPFKGPDDEIESSGGQ